MLTAARDGFALAAAYIPLAAVAASVIVAAVLSRLQDPAWTAAWWAALGAVWFTVEGQRIVAWKAAGPSGLDVESFVTIAAWTLASAGLGYALPAWGGAFVGRRVIFGTGWLSAGVVAATISGIVASLVR